MKLFTVGPANLAKVHRIVHQVNVNMAAFLARCLQRLFSEVAERFVEVHLVRQGGLDLLKLGSSHFDPIAEVGTNVVSGPQTV